jgi:hypothetical protein
MDEESIFCAQTEAHSLLAQIFLSYEDDEKQREILKAIVQDDFGLLYLSFPFIGHDFSELEYEEEQVSGSIEELLLKIKSLDEEAYNEVMTISTNGTLDNMEKYFLFTPGPVNVAETLRLAISKEDICHRERNFDKLLASIEQKLLSLFQIRRRNQYRAVVITGSGTAANEAILSSVVGTGSILILSNGEFGDRLHKTSLIHNPRSHLIKIPWGKSFDLLEIAAYLERHKIDVVAMVHHETCTGMLNPLTSIGALVKAQGGIFVVDGVSSVGAEVVDMEVSNIAFCSSSSSTHMMPSTHRFKFL